MLYNENYSHLIDLVFLMFSVSTTSKLLFLGLLIAVSTSASAEPLLLAESPVSDQPRVSSEITSEEHEDFSIHSQATFIFQQKNSFNSPYWRSFLLFLLGSPTIYLPS